MEGLLEIIQERAAVEGVDQRPGRGRPGDAVLGSGDLGRHGVAVLSVREDLAFESPVRSDCGPVHDLALARLEGGIEGRLRDPTRGGLASVLNEIAADAGGASWPRRPFSPWTRACRRPAGSRGWIPFYMACEGRPAAAGPALLRTAAEDLPRTGPRRRRA